MIRNYDTVVFDLDGTLLDTLDDLRNSANAASEAFGMAAHSRDEIRLFVGNGIRNLIRQVVPDGEAHPDFEKVLEYFKEHYATHCMDKTEPYPGIPALLELMKKAGFQTAIVSNKGDFAVKKLHQVYFKDLIDVAIGERETIRRKPAPDTVLQALSELGASAERTVYVGDSDVDLRTAENCGIDCIAVSWGFRSREFLLEHGADPEMIAENVYELKNLLITTENGGTEQ